MKKLLIVIVVLCVARRCLRKAPGNGAPKASSRSSCWSHRGTRTSPRRTSSRTTRRMAGLFSFR